MTQIVWEGTDWDKMGKGKSPSSNNLHEKCYGARIKSIRMERMMGFKNDQELELHMPYYWFDRGQRQREREHGLGN